MRYLSGFVLLMFTSLHVLLTRVKMAELVCSIMGISFASADPDMEAQIVQQSPVPKGEKHFTTR